MRDPNRIYKYIGKLTEIWQQHPDLRFSQLVNWLDGVYEGATSRDAFYAEDKEYFEVIEKFFNKTET